MEILISIAIIIAGAAFSFFYANSYNIEFSQKENAVRILSIIVTCAIASIVINYFIVNTLYNIVLVSIVFVPIFGLITHETVICRISINRLKAEHPKTTQGLNVSKIA
tara:strand:- start:28978 stop:29301 length:324 start_codon:yes stop_codon:yes gene_type:complete